MNGANLAASTNTNGWAATEMRTFLQSSEERGKLSNNSYIKQVKKKYIKTYNSASSNNNYSNDYLWLLACSEIFATGYQSNAYGCAIASEGEQYQFFKGVNPTWNQNNTQLVKKADMSHWWLRSPYYNYETDFCVINNNGTIVSYQSSYSIGITPGFCI